MGEIETLPNPAPGPEPFLRDQLLERRRRLDLPGLAGREEVRTLIHDVDAALERLAAGEYGLCEECHVPIRPDRLLADPLTRVCLECLSPEQTRALERDLELASNVQAALLPAADVEIDGYRIHYQYRPLGPVSGDHCDVLPPAAPGQPWHFVLGDVSGKGVAASILMSHLHAIFRSLVTLQLPLAEVVRHANRLFTESTLPSSYATLVAGRLDASGTLEICNAGHCPALLAHAGRVIRLGGSGFPLGLFTTSTFETHRVRFEEGDLLFLYTDGFSESRNARGDQYGAERIEQLLGGINGEAPDAVVRACLEALSLFREGYPLEDDLTLMAVRRGG
jgi:sigma-B regulation protein RsbU (phosphoserine phosphatase)